MVTKARQVHQVILYLCSFSKAVRTSSYGSKCKIFFLSINLVQLYNLIAMYYENVNFDNSKSLLCDVQCYTIYFGVTWKSTLYAYATGNQMNTSLMIMVFWYINIRELNKREIYQPQWNITYPRLPNKCVKEQTGIRSHEDSH